MLERGRQVVELAIRLLKYFGAISLCFLSLVTFQEFC